MLIPVSTTNRVEVHLFLGMMTSNSDYGIASGFIESIAVYRLTGDVNL